VEFILTLDESEQLYIPHGSDESRFSLSASLSTIFFISHMVQMKEKGSFFQNPEVGSLYIPHGSDESWLSQQ